MRIVFGLILVLVFGAQAGSSRSVQWKPKKQTSVPLLGNFFELVLSDANLPEHWVVQARVDDTLAGNVEIAAGMAKIAPSDIFPEDVSEIGDVPGDRLRVSSNALIFGGIDEGGRVVRGYPSAS